MPIIQSFKHTLGYIGHLGQTWIDETLASSLSISKQWHIHFSIQILLKLRRSREWKQNWVNSHLNIHLWFNFFTPLSQIFPSFLNNKALNRRFQQDTSLTLETMVQKRLIAVCFTLEVLTQPPLSSITVLRLANAGGQREENPQSN